jgi:hypothetical protein
MQRSSGEQKNDDRQQSCEALRRSHWCRVEVLVSVLLRKFHRQDLTSDRIRELIWNSSADSCRMLTLNAMFDADIPVPAAAAEMFPDCR